MSPLYRRVACPIVVVACTLGLLTPSNAASAFPHAPRPAAVSVRDELPVSAMPIRTRHRRTVSAPASRRPAMRYHGGRVLTGPLKVYVVWYGNWSRRAKRRSIIVDFIRHFSSARFAINTTYPDAAGRTVENSVSLAGQIDDRYSLGKGPLSDDDIARVLAAAIDTKQLPLDDRAAYLVITSNDVQKQGFLTSYCGWHSSRRIGGRRLAFAFIGDPSGPNLRVCAPQAVSPNGDGGGDAMVSIIAHELDEMVTDPDLDAWYDDAGEENADRCSWTYGTTYPVGRAIANVRLGDRHFLIQQNWVRGRRARCAMSIR